MKTYLSRVTRLLVFRARLKGNQDPLIYVVLLQEPLPAPVHPATTKANDSGQLGARVVQGLAIMEESGESGSVSYITGSVPRRLKEK